MKMAANKKTFELDPRLKVIIDDEFAEFEKYLPSPQDVKLYQRKRKEYWDRITARLKEDIISDGRADDVTNSGSTN